MANSQNRVSQLLFVETGGTEDNVPFREPFSPWLPDLAKIQKVPLDISIFVEISLFLYTTSVVGCFFCKRLLGLRFANAFLADGNA